MEVMHWCVGAKGIMKLAELWSPSAHRCLLSVVIVCSLCVVQKGYVSPSPADAGSVVRQMLQSSPSLGVVPHVGWGMCAGLHAHICKASCVTRQGRAKILLPWEMGLCWRALGTSPLARDQHLVAFLTTKATPVEGNRLQEGCPLERGF